MSSSGKYNVLLFRISQVTALFLSPMNIQECDYGAWKLLTAETLTYSTDNQAYRDQSLRSMEYLPLEHELQRKYNIQWSHRTLWRNSYI